MCNVEVVGLWNRMNKTTTTIYNQRGQKEIAVKDASHEQVSLRNIFVQTGNQRSF